ncbi:unnamed protein product [Phaeothamnion confervicola]
MRVAGASVARPREVAKPGAPKPLTEQKSVVAAGSTGAASRRASMSAGNAALDPDRMLKVSTFLKSQIAESELLAGVAGPAAAAMLLRELLENRETAAVGELALYWAARARIEENSGAFTAAQSLLNEGEVFLTVPTQQKVLEMVVAAFKKRMDRRDAGDISRLLDGGHHPLPAGGAATGAFGGGAASAAATVGSGGSGCSGSGGRQSDMYRYTPADVSIDGSAGVDGVGWTKKALRFLVSPPAGAPGAAGGMSPGANDGPEEDLAAYLGCGDSRASPLHGAGAGKTSGGGAFDGGHAAASIAAEDISMAASPFADAGIAVRPSAAVSSPRSNDDAGTVASAPEPAVVTAGDEMPPPEPRPSQKRKGTPYPTRSTKRRSSHSAEKRKPAEHYPGMALLSAALQDGRGDDEEEEEENGSKGRFTAMLSGSGPDCKAAPIRRSRRVAANSASKTPSPMRRELEAMFS